MKSRRHIPRYIVPVIAAALLLSGLLYLGVPRLQAYMKQQEGGKVNAAILQQQKSHAEARTLQLSSPKRLQLQRLGIDLQIKPGTYTARTNTWALDRTHVFYVAPGSAPLQHDAHPLLYGHSIPEVLRSVNGIAKDELLKVTDANGDVYLFRYVSKRVVSPDQGSVLNVRHGKPGLTLMTCSGPRFEDRQLLIFAYEGVQKDAK